MFGKEEQKNSIEEMPMTEEGIFDVASTMIFWSIAIFMITVVLLTFAFVIGGYKNSLTKVPSELQAELIALRFANIPDCFAAEQNGAVMAGVIDVEKFTKERLQSCYNTEPREGIKTFNFKLELKNAGTILTDNYFHNDKFVLRKEVLVLQEGKIKKDQLVIHVQEKIGT